MERLYIFYDLNCDSVITLNKLINLLKKQLIKYKSLKWLYVENNYICDIFYNKEMNNYYEGPYIFYEEFKGPKNGKVKMKKKLNNVFQEFKDKNYVNKFKIRSYFPDKRLINFIENFSILK